VSEAFDVVQRHVSLGSFNRANESSVQARRIGEGLLRQSEIGTHAAEIRRQHCSR
jgi:hypothetical protein